MLIYPAGDSPSLFIVGAAASRLTGVTRRRLVVPNVPPGFDRVKAKLQGGPLGAALHISDRLVGEVVFGVEAAMLIGRGMGLGDVRSDPGS